MIWRPPEPDRVSYSTEWPFLCHQLLLPDVLLEVSADTDGGKRVGLEVSIRERPLDCESRQTKCHILLKT